jgi:HSP20 family protein
MTLMRLRKPEDSAISNLGSIFDNFLNENFFDDNLNTFYPKANIKESSKDFSIELSVPGFDKKDIDLNIDKGVLTVSSTKEIINNEEGESILRKEFGYSSFERRFKIPEIVNKDNIDAKFELGVLKIKLPKIESAIEKPARAIKIA